MYYRLKKNMKGRTFADLIAYLMRRCDVFTFNIPYFSWSVGKNCPEKFDDEFQSYLDDVEEDIADLKPYIIDDYMSNEYFDEKCSHMMRIITVQLNEETFYSIVAANNIYDWRYPARFEDLCFFSKGKCVLYSIAHEEICEIYEIHENEIAFLKKLGLKLQCVDMPERDIQLKYTLSY